MIRQCFNDGWMLCTPKQGGGGFVQALLGKAVEKRPVELPHDATIEQERNPDSTNGSRTGYWDGGEYLYMKEFFVPAEYEEKEMYLEFEGVYMNAMVKINGVLAAQRPYGYSNFYVKATEFLEYGGMNTIAISVKTSAQPNSRWYSGSGIYRDTYLLAGNLIHIGCDGVKMRTLQTEGNKALVEACVCIENGSHTASPLLVHISIQDEEGTEVAKGEIPYTAFAGTRQTVRQQFLLTDAKLWGCENPSLYTCSVRLLRDVVVMDEEKTAFGIRTLSLDTEHGLRINGEAIKLRGGCVHHDNGVLGAKTYEDAEYRRVKMMKEAGFNALRSAHHPMSKAMLSACDRLGMLVMDEAFDMWIENKGSYDYANEFTLWWEKDIEAMVDKDYNHPCVIMYSIGNEISECGTPQGAALARKLAEKVRSLDSTRYTINCINGTLCSMKHIDQIFSDIKTQASEKGTVLEINELMNSVSSVMGTIATHPLVGKLTEEAFSAVDIAGYNYMDERYEKDVVEYPNRLMCGSETFPKDIARNWEWVKRYPQVLGDFTWTAWDYLGEAGLGKLEYEDNRTKGVYGGYPWYIAYCGDFDIIGTRRPISYYREIVWGLRREPYIAVHRPERYGQKLYSTVWGFGDTLGSWSWQGSEGAPVLVDVYADGDEVELFVNGKSAGRQPAGAENAYKASFLTTYQPGKITAVSYKEQREIGRFELSTAAAKARILVEASRESIKAGSRELCYLIVSLVDENGILCTDRRCKVKIDVSENLMLMGYGSADPRSEENFFDREHLTFDGKVLAVVRAKETPGEAVVTFTGEHMGKAEFFLTIV